MSLDDRIKELQDKKRQIGFLKKIQELVIKRATDDTLTPIAEGLNSEIDYQISAIESGERRPDEFEVFSDAEVAVLKGITRKILGPEYDYPKIQEVNNQEKEAIDGQEEE